MVKAKEFSLSFCAVSRAFRESLGLGHQLSKTVVMVGLMGAGKTAVGSVLAAKLNVPFDDTDHAIEAAAKMTIAEIFERDGESFFRQKEAQVLNRLLDNPPHVLSTGGGAFVDPENRAVIAEKGISVWLDVPLDILWSRVKRKTTRPLLQVADPLGVLTELKQAREEAYAKAKIRIAFSDEQTVEDTTDMVIEALKETGGIV